MANRVVAPRPPPTSRADVVAIAVVLMIWLLPWASLRLAASLAGGHPTASPYDVINPSRLRHLYLTDGGHLIPEHLIGASGNLRRGAFWTIMAVQFLTASTVTWTLVGRLSPAGRVAGFAIPRSLPRTSHWATRKDLRGLRRRGRTPGCFTLGRRGPVSISTEAETSVLVIGPTRSGKTTGLVIPNLFEWTGPAIATSTKSELVDVTGEYRRSVGPVSVYDPTGELGSRYQTVSWSPIVGCESLDHAWMVASWLCAGLQQSSGGKADNDWAHWAESGKLLIAPLLHIAASTGSHTIVDVRNWIHGFDMATPMAILERRLDAEPDPHGGDSERAMAMLISVDQRPEKERGTVFSTVMRIFSVFNEKAVAASALTSDFDPETFLQRRGTLYLCTPRQAPERIASLFVGILMTAVTKAYGMAQDMPRGILQPQLGLFLDELANVVPVEDLPALASQGAGRGVLLMSIVQDLSQLRSRYGADRANSILNNHPAKIVLPGLSDPETTEVVAKMVGTSSFTDIQITSTDGRNSRSHSVRQEPMASPDALRQLPAGTGIVVYKGRPPTLVRLRPWFASRRLRRLAQHGSHSRAPIVAAGRRG